MKKLPIFLIMLCWMFVKADEASHEEIARLRMLQIHAPYGLFMKVEKRIDALKQAQDNQKQDNWFPRLYPFLFIIPYGIWQLLCLIAWWIFLIIFVLRKEKYTALYRLCLGLFFISGSILMVDYYYTRQQWGIVQKKSAAVYGSAHDSSFVRTMLDYVSEVKILKQHADWYQVKTDQLIGWMKKDDIYVQTGKLS
ncbi:MAG: hypothetical protein WA432_01230 [Candidatus Babeliaceae bacterium]